MYQGLGKAKSFQDLEVWQKAHSLVLDIYLVTKSFPEEERFGLINQMRRAAVSITSNIAEGFNRQGQKDKVQFYSVAQSSLAELQSQLMIVKDLGLDGDCEASLNLSSEVHRMLTGLIKAVRTTFTT